jgi:hypothetical protein
MLIQQTINLGSMTFESTVLQFYCSFQTRMVFSSLMYIISVIVFLLILDLGSRWGWVVSITPRLRFTPSEKTPGTLWTRGWVGPRAGLDTEVRGKILCLYRGSSLVLRVVQSVVRLYIDWDTRLRRAALGVPCVVEDERLCRKLIENHKTTEDFKLYKTVCVWNAEKYYHYV